MSIGQDEVLHVAKLAELAVSESEIAPAGGPAEPDRGLRRRARTRCRRTGRREPFLAGPEGGHAPGGRGGPVPLARPPAAIAPEFVEGFFLVPRHGAMEDE